MENQDNSEDSMEVDDAMEMDIDDTVPNATIIENKSLSDSLTNQSTKDKSDDEDDILIIDDVDKNKTSAAPVPESNDPLTVTQGPEDDIVVLDDDDDEDSSNAPPLPPQPTTPTDEVKSSKDCEIIDLVSKKLCSANSKCINYACTSGMNLATAPNFCLTFYRVKSNDSKRREVCEACFDIALLHFEKLSKALINKELLLDVEIPIRNDLVEIDDSDSEEEEEARMVEYFDDENFNFINDNIDEVLKETMIKYDIGRHADLSMEFLMGKGKHIAEQFSEVDKMIHGVRKQLDAVHHDLYSEFKIRYEHLPPIEITDINNSYVKTGIRNVHSSTEATPTTYLSKSQLNLRKSKPISYIELDDSGSKPSSPAVGPLSRESILEPVELPLDLPVKGAVLKPPLKIGAQYYTNRNSKGSWGRVQLTNFVKPGQIVNGIAMTQTMYCVTMPSKQQSKYPTSRIISGKDLAYDFPSTVQLDVGTRVIAAFKDNDGDIKKKRETFFPGIIAEPLLPSNRFRYLVFFDDGYAQYVSYNMVYLIYEVSKNVWEDMHIDSRDFIKKYLQLYPERPMVMLRKDQKVPTEFEGKWFPSKVVNVDCSLVQIKFDTIERTEWIYKGSTRLNPMFKEEQAAANRLQIRSRTIRKMNESGPYVQYTRNEGEQAEVRAVARKSTSVVSQAGRVAAAIPFLPPTTQPNSKVVYFTPRAQANTNTVYKTHVCSAKCKSFITYDVKKLKGYNPLSKPLLCGWHRLTYKHRGKREINYKSPCGRFIRSMPELHKYLRLTESEMTVDLFDFDFWVHCLAEFVLEKNCTIKRDMSDGLETVSIPIVNYVDKDPNPFNSYSIKRMPMEGVNLNVDPEFLCGCDCEDDCVNKEKCQCWQLTLMGLPFLGRNAPEFIGYTYRRLPEPVVTGIYECNSRCKCASTCLNRVVQNPLQLKLQVFKTTNRGWGIRCLNDIPQGAFICIYAGSMLTEQMANEGGKNYGDEYLAELDYIEVVEKMKEDYEEEAAVSEDDEKSQKSKPDSGDEDGGYKKKRPLYEDDDFVPYVFLPKGKDNPTYKSRLRKRTVDEDKSDKDTKSESETDEKKPIGTDDETVMISDDEDIVHEPSSFNPKSHSDLDDSRPSMYTSVRELYGKDECVYVMDAKVSGNIGRYLNHSCSPNVFVQNVFVDTHDLRFPWVAFFALTYIRAGTELTWNYNYDVGSVPGKILYCRCDSAECRGRLL